MGRGRVWGWWDQRGPVVWRASKERVLRAGSGELPWLTGVHLVTTWLSAGSPGTLSTHIYISLYFAFPAPAAPLVHPVSRYKVHKDSPQSPHLTCYMQFRAVITPLLYTLPALLTAKKLQEIQYKYSASSLEISSLSSQQINQSTDTEGLVNLNFEVLCQNLDSQSFIGILSTLRCN